MLEQLEESSIALPIAFGAAAIGGFMYLRHRQSRGEEQGARSDEIAVVPSNAVPPAPAGRWVFPVPRWQGRAPVISDGWGSPRRGDGRGTIHRGADIMFRRRSLGELVDVYPPRAPHTRWHFLPPGTLGLAASDGEVWSAGWTSRGYTVVLSHGAPWATYYTHLESLRVGESRRGSSKQRVRAGEPIGVIGADPQDGNAVAHLHFELWFGGDGRSAIDPAPYLRRFFVIDSPEVN